MVLSRKIAFNINLSLKTETVPSMWKISKIVPIYKSGPPEREENYRPILSVLSILLCYTYWKVVLGGTSMISPLWLSRWKSFIEEKCKYVSLENPTISAKFLITQKLKNFSQEDEEKLSVLHYGCSYVAKIHFIYLLLKKSFMFSKKSFVFKKSVLCYQKSVLYSKKVFYVLKTKVFCIQKKCFMLSN